MADNVAVTAGSGTSIATDDVAGQHYQRIKLADGTADSSTAIAAGNGTEATALRVTVASDSTGVVAAKLKDGAGTAITSATRGAEQALSVQIVNAAGTQITSFGGGTQYAEDDASAGAESLTLAGAVRRDTPASSSGTAGDYSTINTDSVGRLWVNATLSNSSGTNIVKAGDSVSDPSHNGLIPLAVRKDTPATISDTDGDYEMLQASGGRLWTSAVVTAATTSIGKEEDVASANADVGVPAMAVRKGSPANTSGTDGDYEFLQMSNGRLWTSSHMTDVNGATVVSQTNALFSDPANGILALTVRKDAPATISDMDGDYEVMQSSGGRLWASSQVYGDVAHDGGDSGNPVKIGGKASSGLSGATLVANNDRANAISDLDGVLVHRPFVPLGDVVMERVSDTGGSSTAFSNFGATASTRNYLTTITVYNDSATTGYLDIRDGTAGTVLHTIPLPAKGGGTINLPIPLRSSANTALAYDVSAALTTVYISVVGFRSKC